MKERDGAKGSSEAELGVKLLPSPSGGPSQCGWTLQRASDDAGREQFSDPAMKLCLFAAGQVNSNNSAEARCQSSEGEEGWPRRSRRHDWQAGVRRDLGLGAMRVTVTILTVAARRACPSKILLPRSRHLSHLHGCPNVMCCSETGHMDGTGRITLASGVHSQAEYWSLASSTWTWTDVGVDVSVSVLFTVRLHSYAQAAGMTG